MSLLKLSNISKSYGSGEHKTIALDDVNLEIKSGEFVAIVGKSGSGKSTLLKILSGIYKNYEGELSYLKVDSIFYSGHKTGLKNNLSARENIYFDIRLPKISYSQINSVLKKLIIFLSDL